jgi:hypothetical protein
MTAVGLGEDRQGDPRMAGVAIGMTTVRDTACFGLYAASDPLPDSDRLAEAVNHSIDELLEHAEY